MTTTLTDNATPPTEITLTIDTDYTRTNPARIVTINMPGKLGTPAEFFGRHSKELKFNGFTTVKSELRKLEEWASSGFGLASGQVLTFKHTTDAFTAPGEPGHASGMSCYIAAFSYRELVGTETGAEIYVYSMVLKEKVV